MSLQPGDRVAGYTIERLIGRGGMGAVYLARHARLQRAAALKVMVPELAEDDSYIERFVRESQLAASLEHPNVVPIYDADEHDGLLFIAMRYVEGSDLRRLLQQEGTLTPEHTLRIVEAVAGALDAAHAEKLVHRDVKPANILIEQPGERVFLTDFGVAKRSGLTTMTVAGARVGTADYCAPEQISGHEVDGRADVYSLTCVAFHCLAGQPPYPRDSELAVAHAHVHDPVPALSTVRPGLPRELDGVIAVGMAKNPEVRYATAGELARSARAANEDRTAPTLLAAAPTAAPGDDTVPGPTGEAPTPPVGAPPRKSRRWRPAYWLAVAAGAAVIAAVVVAVALVGGGDDDGSDSIAQPTTTVPPPPPPPIREHFARVGKRQQALTSAVVAADRDAKSFARMKTAADDVAAEITRFEGFLDGLAVPKAEQGARASLRRALTAHLAYAHSFRNFPSEPESFTGEEARTTTSLAEQAEAAYRQSASLNPTLPVIALSRADHEHLIDLVPDEPPPPPPPQATVRFTSVDRLQRCSATAAFVRCSSGPSGEVVQLRPGGQPTYLGRLGSTDTGGRALAEGASVLVPGGKIRCISTSRGITCTDLRTGASFTLGDDSHTFGFPAVYSGRFTSSDRLQRCTASDQEVVCGSGPSGQVVVLDAGSGARYAGVVGSSDQGGPAMAQGTSFRTPGGTIECSSTSRGITCTDLAGSGESFTIGDHYVNANGVRYAG